ncbi:trihelix transcription factor GT-2 [Populus alba]|uniref:Trihelix transcription factor GT-2-like n=2 Tax=Populus TaxID=3689 RepID=A0A4U5Q100_POPAL|nr:trihelix transcription factor GT-2-like [Populus alba]KAJ6998187.1 trihelix transcription factor GT-2-like [Populus alba x Populus x berolinensis]TKS03660.1 trihelix transcription factor GT-2-like [Populus alba]
MLGDSSVLASSSDVETTATRVVPGGGEVCEVGGAGGFGSNSTEEDKNTGGDIHEGDRMNYGANRWPRQETLALLKIRSAMDAVFRDSSLKGPLWEEVSRKLAELGYHRSAKKCKEKFENLYKYHKRTKEGRTGKSEGKTYKFFDELEAFQNHHSHSAQPPTILAPPLPPPKAQTPTATTATLPWTNSPAIVSHVTVQSTTNPIDILSQGIATPTTIHTISPMPLSSNSLNPSQHTLPSSLQNLATHFFSSSTSSSTASDEKLEGSRKRKRKRNWKDFFLRLTKDVIKKQEDLQKKFLETVEKCDHERMAREDAWRMKEMAIMNRQHEILIQERSTAAAKDAAVFAFLQKISGQQNSTETQAIPQPKLTPSPTQPPQPRPPPTSLEPVTNLVVSKWDNGENVTVSSSSRWPKVEVQALISLRADLDIKYQEHGAKGPLWEDISAGMQKLGYNRSAKRCKEKWENINKYFKKVKESNRKRPGDSKTCPYFDQLDALYKEKNKMESRVSTGYAVKSISTMEPLMVRPEQQCPFEQANQPETITEDNERDINIDHNIEEEDDDDDDMDDDTEEEDEGVGFEVVANRPASLTIGE